MTLAAGLRLATGTLTVIPVGDIGAPDRRVGRSAMLLAPVAALPLGVTAAAIVAGGQWVGLPPFVTAAVALAALAGATRAMHLDGLADTADGFGGGWDRERALEIMHRGDVGPMGVAALILVLLAQAGAIATLAVADWGWLLTGVATVAARCACTLMCATRIPAARATGLGAVVASSVPISAALATLAAATGVSIAVALIAGISWWVGLLAALLAWLAVTVLVRGALRRLGGITGDVLGAGIEIAATALLIIYSAGVLA